MTRWTAISGGCTRYGIVDSILCLICISIQLMAKWEELNKNMAPAYRVSSQIKDIKRLLDMFEATLG